MSQKECFLLFLTCVVIIGWLITFALIKDVDGVMFGSGIGGICAIAGYTIRAINKKGSKT